MASGPHLIFSPFLEYLRGIRGLGFYLSFLFCHPLPQSHCCLFPELSVKTGPVASIVRRALVPGGAAVLRHLSHCLNKMSPFFMS